MIFKGITLRADQMPRRYYNILADLPGSLPPVLHPATKAPVGPEDLAPIFPMALIEQEVSSQREISIPEPVLEAYSAYRPSPLIRANGLEQMIGTRSKIYYKYEGVSPAGSHKPNTAIAQAYYNSLEGVKRLATETGAGQWGSSLSYACKLFGLKCKVYMVRVSYDQKPYRKSMMKVWGAEIVASPSADTESGKKILEQDPRSPGSLGIAISEAVEDAAGREDTKYSLGSVLNHVLLHQTIIGLETQSQFASIDSKPDVIVGCFGGGSNFAGLALPYVREVINGEQIKIVAIEPEACPTLTQGSYKYDFGDTAELTPLLPMFTLGHKFIPGEIHAGGLRYHGASPIVSHLLKQNLISAIALPQHEAFEAALAFAGTEGFVPAPESSHAIAGAIREAKLADDEGTEKTIVFNLSGHGHFDMSAYDDYLAGRLQNSSLSTDALSNISNQIRSLPEIQAI